MFICVVSDAAILKGQEFLFAALSVKAELPLAYRIAELQFLHFFKKNPLKVTIIAHVLISPTVHRSMLHLI